MTAHVYDLEVREAPSHLQAAAAAFDLTSTGQRLPAWLRLAHWRRLRANQRAGVHDFFVVTIASDRHHLYTCTCSLVVERATDPATQTMPIPQHPSAHNGHLDHHTWDVTHLLICPASLYTALTAHAVEQPLYTVHCQGCRWRTDPLPLHDATKARNMHSHSANGSSSAPSGDLP